MNKNIYYSNFKENNGSAIHGSEPWHLAVILASRFKQPILLINSPKGRRSILMSKYAQCTLPGKIYA